MKMNTQRKKTGMPYSLKGIQCIIIKYMTQSASWRATSSRSIAPYYVSAFTTTKPDTTTTNCMKILSPRAVAVLRNAPDNI